MAIETAARTAAGTAEKRYSNASIRGAFSRQLIVTKGTCMQIQNVGVVSPGDMGQAIAGRLKESGMNVYTALDGRSERTKALARAAGLDRLRLDGKARCDLRAGDLGHQSRRSAQRGAPGGGRDEKDRAQDRVCRSQRGLAADGARHGSP